MPPIPPLDATQDVVSRPTFLKRQIGKFAAATRFLEPAERINRQGKSVNLEVKG